jgi:predicted HAD superfamily phosphohydrolase
VSNNFDEIPEKVRNELLVKLTDNESAHKDVAWTVEHNSEKIPDSIRDEILRKLEKK